MRCPLCTANFDDVAKFCGACYERAKEAIDRREDGVTEQEQAVQVALIYLGFLYGGDRSLTVTKEAELACLAVTVAADVRSYRAKIVDLENDLHRLRQPTLADRELADLMRRSE